MRELFRNIRRLFWRRILGLPNTHPTFLCGGYSNISKDFIAGMYSYVGPGCLISPGLSIGNYTMLGPGVKVVGNDHVFDKAGVPIIHCGRPTHKDTIIGHDVWIGANAIVICGNSIGNGALVAAGAVVTRDVPPYAVVAGVPARMLSSRFSADEIRKHEEMLGRPVLHVKYPDRR